MCKVKIVTHHRLVEDVKTSVHKIYEHAHSFGYNVEFLSLVAPHKHFFSKKNHVDETSIVSPWYPYHFYDFINVGLFNFLSKKLSKITIDALYSGLVETDIFIFESSIALVLFPHLKRINSNAKFIYKCSDLLDTIKTPQKLRSLEKQILPTFDKVSVPSVYMKKILNNLSNNIVVEKHAVDKRKFNKEHKNPYNNNVINMVFVGMSKLDQEAIEDLAELDNVEIHIIGPFNNLIKKDNVIYYGKMPFNKTIRYIKFADIGLQVLVDGPHFESFSDSLKVQQYRYCGLKVIAPMYFRNYVEDKENWFFYKLPSMDIDLLQNFLKKPQEKRSSNILDWTEYTSKLLNI